MNENDDVMLGISALLPENLRGAPKPPTLCPVCGEKMGHRRIPGKNDFESQWLRGQARIFDGETKVETWEDYCPCCEKK